LDHRVDQRGHVALLGDVGGEQFGLAACFPDRTHHPLAARPVHIDDRNLGALGREQFRDLLADIATGASDHRYLIPELHPSPLAPNAEDMAEAKASGATAAFLDRLALDERRVAAMADGLDVVRALPDPVGTVTERWTRPNGMTIERVRVPIGVVGIIYESRPNVTADAAALCLKAGNAAILRGGSESYRSNQAIHAALIEGMQAASLPEAAIALVPSRDRSAVGMMLSGLDGTIDMIVPRGGKSLVARVQAEARVPVFAHLEGICHVYVDKAAKLD